MHSSDGADNDDLMLYHIKLSPKMLSNQKSRVTLDPLPVINVGVHIGMQEVW
jgi:hypothetical protein